MRGDPVDSYLLFSLTAEPCTVKVGEEQLHQSDRFPGGIYIEALSSLTKHYFSHLFQIFYEELSFRRRWMTLVLEPSQAARRREGHLVAMFDV